jgi:hypothetical protein
MEVIKRQISLENSVDRNYDSQTYGTITATTFFLNIELVQNYDDMGLFTDIITFPKSTTENAPDYTILIQKLQASGFSFPFMNGSLPISINGLTSPTDDVTLRYPDKPLNMYYNFGNNSISGLTDSKLEDVRSYDNNDPYRIAFDVNTETYINYNNLTINGVNRIYSMGEPKKYAFDAITGPTLAQINQPYGLQYSDYTRTTRSELFTGDTVDISATSFRFVSEGWNNTNTSLSALTKEEFLLGIISRPEVENDVLIDRGVIPVLDLHLRLSEIRNLGQLKDYGNGYYKIDLI